MKQYQGVRKLVSAIAACAVLLGGAIQSAQACTGITLIAADLSVVRARTMEFGIDLGSEVIMVPR
ncbi:MAG TPA: linear amide C-N hydrolase, partial [Thermoanaerobaculia bacterium]|nr:linear amide C-N hydrolase [Thermoanaerobaculia bacterium]